MPKDLFKCPQCGRRTTKKRIVENNYACSNPKCGLNVRLVVHGEVTNTGKISKLYGWVLEPGTVLKKKYEIIKMIGKGGFGATYLARDISMFNQLRAIKEIPKQYCDDKEDEFLTLLSHPSIPKLFERFNLGKFHYSVMEFISGESLEEKIKLHSKPLREAEVIKLTEQLCAVLKYIHSQNVVHRDLKPDNVLIRKNGKISLIDFGIAKKFHSGLGTRHLARAASSFYSSPEQYRPGKGFTDFKSDIYSLGAILYYISTGVEPTDALSRDPSKSITPLPRDLNSQISKKLESVIVKATRMNKTDRFKNIEELKTALPANGKMTSSRICPKCQVTINPGDKFCRNCGSSTHPIKKRPTSSFVFNSRKKANTIRQLVQICYNNWNEAIPHLYNGNFETWLKSIPGGNALAKKAATIRKEQSDKNLGLNEFLSASGFGDPARIQIHPVEIKAGKLPRGARKRLMLTISNKGQGYLKGRITFDAKWISVNQDSFVCFNSSTKRLSINVDTRLLSAYKKYNSKIVITSNGGNKTIPISVYVTSMLAQPISKSDKNHKSSIFNSYLSTIIIFAAMALLIRFLGPTANLSLSKPWIIIVIGLLVGVMNIEFGKIGFIVGFLLGASLGAALNIISYYTYFFIDEKVVVPVLKHLKTSYTAQLSYTGWGMIGIYVGGTFAFFKKRGRKKNSECKMNG